MGFRSERRSNENRQNQAIKRPVATSMSVRLSHAPAPPAPELCTGPARPLGDPPGTSPPPTCRLTCRQFTRDRPQLSATQIHQFFGCLQPRLTADLLVARGFLRVAHARHDVFQPAERRRELRTPPTTPRMTRTRSARRRRTFPPRLWLLPWPPWPPSRGRQDPPRPWRGPRAA